MFRKQKIQSIKSFLFSYAPFLVLFFFLSYIAYAYYQRVGSFSFGDEYNNIIAGYFMGRGRELYSQIFFNHQMMMAYISFVIQKLLHSQTLYQLILYHRIFVVFFSSLMLFLIVWRFRWVGVGLALFFESTKYYLFGHLFLAESLTVYPIVYLFGIALLKIEKRNITRLDILLSAVFTWFVIFLREPYAPLAIILFISIIFSRKLERKQIQASLVIVVLTIITLIPIIKSLNEYLFQVIIFNSQTVFPAESKANSIFGIGIVKIFFYPVFIFLSNEWNFFRQQLIIMSSIYIALVVLLIKYKKFHVIFFLFFIHAISLIRFVAPGKIYFEAFHMIVWYGIFLFTIFFILEIIRNSEKKPFSVITIIFLSFAFLNLQISPNSFLTERINRNEEFTVNYAHHYVNGELFRTLSSPGDTLFADQWDYLHFWQAGLDSSYKYAVYTFVMAGYPKYQKEREIMFQRNPPVFYYTFCPKNVYTANDLPITMKQMYVQIMKYDKPYCSYILKTKLSQITSEQWAKANSFGFHL